MQFLASKRDEYFEAGTQVVWDVDAVARVVRCYRAGAAEPQVFAAGTIGQAEPAVPGGDWRSIGSCRDGGLL
jgi:Uma2 family endonuclease